ncbi:MAG: asparagine synthase (glutamine-hydrolyzing) [Bacteroidales bacterium]|nr:asparagine synthase (glutamine-hydrolyzing) [Bacteroidales bacterium]
MCGIVGYYRPKPIDDLKDLYKATSLICHRGPDDEGYAVFNVETGGQWTFSGPDSPADIRQALPQITNAPATTHHLALGFRRYSIVELSSKGHQPFWNKDKTVCLTLNGEIYNYVELREELEKMGCKFESRSDTEVLLAGHLLAGNDFLKRCNGPFAIVIYNKNKQKLFFARDRIGKNPLYYTISGGNLYWASEIKSILHLAGKSSFSINDQAVYDFVRYGWRDLDHQTFWSGIKSTPQACWTEIDLKAPLQNSIITDQAKQYWQIPTKRLTPKSISFADAKNQFQELLLDAVRIRSRADAKVAFSLSGGMDSSAIVGVAAAHLQAKMTTYTVKYPGHHMDEEPYARMLYKRYPGKLEYQVHLPKNDDFWKIADEYIWLQEEPFHSPNANVFQSYFHQARTDGFKAMIIGGGGDECLAGYLDYFVPFLYFLRRQHCFGSMIKNLFLRFDKFDLDHYQPLKKIGFLFRLLLDNKTAYAHNTVVTSFFHPSGNDVTNAFFRDNTLTNRTQQRSGAPREFNELMIGYMSNWLMNYFQRNSNRSHFGVPMEPRSPFLDYRLVDLSFTLPPQYLIHNGWTKYILRKASKDVLPYQVVWRRQKAGFPFNIKEWLKNSKPIVESQILSIQDNPYISTKKIRDEYDSLINKNPLFLWRCISLCLWWKRVVQGESLNIYNK